MIGLIAARSENHAIGKCGRIPWRIRGEQKQFQALTRSHVVVMGRRTYEEIGRPLPERLTIVVSKTMRSADFNTDNTPNTADPAARSATNPSALSETSNTGLLVASSLEEALTLAQNEEARQAAGFSIPGERNVYIAGGERLYREAISLVDKIYLTEVDLVVEQADQFFPEFDESAFDLTVGETSTGPELGGTLVRYTRKVYTRRVSVKQIGDHEIIFRKMTGAELDRFISMRITQLTEEYTSAGREAPTGVDLTAALRDYYERHMADGTFVSWLAFDGERIVGTSGMSIVEKPPYFSCPTGRLGLLSSMYTDPAYRRMGLAKELLSRVVEEARDRGCGAVWITASDMGVKLYTAYGFEHNGNFMQYRF